ncbi:MAG: hypothetical protein ACREVS_09650 [Burkholderiales bacterium]
MRPRRRTGTRRTQIHLPPLTAEQALLVADLLERAIRALWRAHGDAMADHLGRTDPDRMLAYHSPDDVVTGKPDADEPDDF